MKRKRKTLQDPWISSTVTNLNVKHQSFWKHTGKKFVDGNRLEAFQILDKQHRELANTGKLPGTEGIFSWLHKDTGTHCMMTSVSVNQGINPVRPDIVILRQHPGKIALQNSENAFSTSQNRNNGTSIPCDHLGWVNNFRKYGLPLDHFSLISAYLCPYYMENNKYNRDGGTKNMRNILAWRFKMLLWLLEPKYLVATNLLFAKLVESGFDFNSYVDKKGITTKFCTAKGIAPPPFFSKKVTVYPMCLRMPHPYLMENSDFSQEKRNVNRVLFADSVRFLTAVLTGDAQELKEGTIEVKKLTIPMLQKVAPMKGKLVLPANTEEDAEEEKYVPNIFTLDGLNTFRQPSTGPCECGECGGCGAYQQSELKDGSFESCKTLYPTSDSYKIYFTKPSLKECVVCQCKHGHRSVEFNECPQGCPEGGFKERHRKLLRNDEYFTNEEFMEELVHRPETFGNKKLLYVMEKNKNV